MTWVLIKSRPNGKVTQRIVDHDRINSIIAMMAFMYPEYAEGETVDTLLDHLKEGGTLVTDFVGKEKVYWTMEHITKVLVCTSPPTEHRGEYRAEYDHPATIEGIIARMSSTYDVSGLTPIGIALKLGAGETLRFVDPFWTEVCWKLEDKS